MTEPTMTEPIPASPPPASPPPGGPPPGEPPPGAGTEPGVPTTGRRWWRVLGGLFAAAFLVMCTLQVVSFIGRSSETVRRELPADGITQLEIRSDSGDISVSGSDRDDIAIVARIDHGLQRTRAVLDVDGGVLTAEADCPFLSNHCDVQYTIEVPDDLPVSVTAGNGDVSVRDLRGTVHASSDNGNVEAVALSGITRLDSDNGDVQGRSLRLSNVEATSDNGDVMIELLTAPAKVLAESQNGDVDVVLPGTRDAYDLTMSTRNGERFGQIRTDPDSDRRLTIRSSNGDVTVGYRLA